MGRGEGEARRDAAEKRTASQRIHNARRLLAIETDRGRERERWRERVGVREREGKETQRCGRRAERNRGTGSQRALAGHGRPREEEGREGFKGEMRDNVRTTLQQPDPLYVVHSDFTLCLIRASLSHPAPPRSLFLP